ncbi:hypothetical protein ID866_12536 [Astraeus odoratus]|nr:hypothetical protein ID866_12536 [Astraeus odoratus]
MAIQKEINVTAVLCDVLYVPSSPNNLVLITCLDETGGHAEMVDRHTKLYDKNNKSNFIWALNTKNVPSQCSN